MFRFEQYGFKNVIKGELGKLHLPFHIKFRKMEMKNYLLKWSMKFCLEQNMNKVARLIHIWSNKIIVEVNLDTGILHRVLKGSIKSYLQNKMDIFRN